MQTPIRRTIPARPESAFRKPLPRTAPRLFRFIPRSTAINFLALILLGGLVFALQSFGRKSDPSSSTAQPPTAPAAVVAAPEVKLEPAAAPVIAIEPAAAPAVAAAPEAAPLPSAEQVAIATIPPTTTVQAPATAPAVETPPANAPAAPASPPAVYTLKNPATEGTAEKPRVDASKTRVAKQQATSATRDRWTQDRNVAIEDLDGEGARQAYLRQTGAMPSPTASREELSASSQPQPRRAPVDDLAMEGTPHQRSVVPPPAELNRGSRNIEGDLDGEVARLNYLKQNNGAPGSTTASERRTVVVPNPQPVVAAPPAGGSPRSFIPYEQ